MSGVIDETSFLIEGLQCLNQPTMSFADDSVGTPLRIHGDTSVIRNYDSVCESYDAKHTRLVIEENNNNNNDDEKIWKDSSVREQMSISQKFCLPKRFLELSRKQLVFLFLLVFGNFLFSACYSLLATFFPQEAEQKGASTTQCGLVFGIFQLIIFVACPIFGKLVPYYTITFLLNSSVFVVGTCCILFGLLDQIEAGIKFIAFAFAIRSVKALGTALFYTAAYAAVPEEFPHNPTTIYSVLETSFGLGMITGPSIGGALYHVGGFITPFVALGSFLLFTLVLNICFHQSSEKETKSLKVDMLKIIYDPGFSNDILLCVSYCIVIGFNEATLEIHLRQFDLSHIVLGTMFIIAGGVYAISTLLWGMLCQRNVDPHLIGVFGCAICAVSYLMIGPAPFIESPTYISVVVLSQVFMGCGTGAQVICAYVHGMRNTIVRGFPDNTATYAAVSGILNSFTALGSFIGPSLGGFLLEWFTYRESTVFIFGIEVVIATVIVLLRFIGKYRQQPRCAKDEKRPLLSKTKTIVF